MAFSWKDKKDMFKGEGIYFLTFTVNNRAPLLGKLKPLGTHDSEGHIAMVETSTLGKAVYREFNALQSQYEGFQVIAKQIMENHFHAVCWCKSEFGNQSVKMVARHFAQGCSKIARRLVQASIVAQSDCAHTNDNERDRPTDKHTNDNERDRPTDKHTNDNRRDETTGDHLNENGRDETTDKQTYDCGNGANTLFETPYIRTLSHVGQLKHMIAYTHSNPDNAWLRHLNPRMYVIRRGHEYKGLHFDIMGKERLLAYPDRQVIALSRSLSPDKTASEVQKALRLAESGTITYTAAINEGEKRVTRAVREAGYPLVIMMLDGFPMEGSEAARYFHPGGIYHRLCGEGKLCLMAPQETNYDNPLLIQLTEQELDYKASQKGQHYTGIPHSTKRWRMIAGNVMLKIIAGEV